jgi:hypothetical protein
MVWGCMCIHRPKLIYKVEGCINQSRYHDILDENVHRTISKFNLDTSYVMFQHDNVPIYTTKILQEWFLRQSFILLHWLVNPLIEIPLNTFGQFSNRD